MPPSTWAILGWEIDGVNLAAARLAGAEPARIVSRPDRPGSGSQRDGQDLEARLAATARALGAGPGARHAVTLGSEIDQRHRTTRETVEAALDALVAAFPDSSIHLLSTAGRFVTVPEARREPLAVAGGAWRATAELLAAHHPDALLLHVGSATTQFVPIEYGKVAARAHTTAERLASGELIYCGALRTPVEAVAESVPLDGRLVGVVADGVAIMGDVHLWRGALEPADYTVEPPDGRAATRPCAGERIARIVGADHEQLDESAIGFIAAALAAAQVARLERALQAVLARHPRIGQVIAAGSGEFLAVEAARQAMRPVERLSALRGVETGRAPAAIAAATLLARRHAD